MARENLAFHNFGISQLWNFGRLFNGEIFFTFESLLYNNVTSGAYANGSSPRTFFAACHLFRVPSRVPQLCVASPSVLSCLPSSSVFFRLSSAFVFFRISALFFLFSSSKVLYVLQNCLFSSFSNSFCILP